MSKHPTYGIHSPLTAHHSQTETGYFA